MDKLLLIFKKAFHVVLQIQFAPGDKLLKQYTARAVIGSLPPDAKRISTISFWMHVKCNS